MSDDPARLPAFLDPYPMSLYKLFERVLRPDVARDAASNASHLVYVSGIKQIPSVTGMAHSYVYCLFDTMVFCTMETPLELTQSYIDVKETDLRPDHLALIETPANKHIPSLWNWMRFVEKVYLREAKRALASGQALDA
jgi:hypothetical protein